MSKRIEAKVAVIGLGILGSAVLRALYQTGERDLVAIERAPSFAGASAQSFGMLRVYHESRNLRELALASHQLASVSRERPLGIVKPFLSLRRQTPALMASIYEINAKGYRIDVLNAQTLAADYGIEAPPRTVGVLEPEALTFDPHELLNSYHRAVLPGIHVVRDDVRCLIEKSHSVDIVTDGGTCITAGKLVIAAGVGSVPLLAGRGLTFQQKAISYNVARQSINYPQFLNAETREFISQRRGRTYYRLAEGSSLGAQLISAGHWVGHDIASETCQESFGQIPGSKRVFFMGAWGGNGFKLAWRLAKITAEMVLAKKLATPGVTYEKLAIL